MTTNAEQIIARHIAGALRDIQGIPGHTPVDDLPDELATTAAIVAAECVAELEGRSGAIARIHIVDGPSESWPVVERVPDGWQSGAHHYRDEQVQDVEVIA